MNYGTGLMKATDEKSCDTCDFQEGRHYCLLHTMQIKNMDMVRCKNWSDKRAEEHHAMHKESHDPRFFG